VGVWGWIGRAACRETVMGGEIVSREEGKEDERECGSGSGSFFFATVGGIQYAAGWV
jgi:hypothetical protein